MEQTHSRPTPEDDIAAVLGRFRAWNSDQEELSGEGPQPAQIAGLREITYEEALGVRPVRRVPGAAESVAATAPVARPVADAGSVRAPALMPAATATSVSATSGARTQATGTNATGAKPIPGPLAGPASGPVPKPLQAAPQPAGSVAASAVRPAQALQSALPIRHALTAPAPVPVPVSRNPVSGRSKTVQPASGEARPQDRAAGQALVTSKKASAVRAAPARPGGSTVKSAVSPQNVSRTGLGARAANPGGSRKRSPVEVSGRSPQKAAPKKAAPQRVASQKATSKQKPVATFAAIMRQSLQPVKGKGKIKAKVKPKPQSQNREKPVRAKQPGGSARNSSKSSSGKSQPGKSLAGKAKGKTSPSGKSPAAKGRGGDAKSIAMKLRISPGDHAKIKAGAAEAGVTLAAYMRLCTLDVQVLRGLLTQTISDLKVIPTAAPPQRVETALVRRPHPIVAAAPSEGIMTRLKVLLFGD